MNSVTVSFAQLLLLLACVSCREMPISKDVGSPQDEPKALTPENVSEKIRLVGFAKPPRPVAAILRDRRYDPAKTYVVRAGDRRGGLEIIDIDEAKRAVLLRVKGQGVWIHLYGDPPIGTTPAP